MSIFRVSSREKALARIAPITGKPGTERRMRVAVLRAKRKAPLAAEFARQQAFDQAVAALIRDIPVSAKAEEWFRNEALIPSGKRGWKRFVRNPAVLSIALALAVIAGVMVFTISERMGSFPGADTARKMLGIASSTRGITLDPIDAEAGTLGDFFFLKYRLEHYDVPPEFAKMRTFALRVFDDDEGHRVAQIFIPSKRLQLFLFPADRDAKTSKPREFSGWRFVEQEGWTGAVQMQNGVCFMAALRGDEKALAPYLAAPAVEPTPAPAGR